jgi:hypothetical protein
MSHAALARGCEARRSASASASASAGAGAGAGRSKRSGLIPVIRSAEPRTGHVRNVWGCGWRTGRRTLRTMPRKSLYLSTDPKADALLTKTPLALLVGMVLDQQIQ